MARKPPRYDLPNAAPAPLRTVQLFVNTIDLSHDREWLTAWLGEQGLQEVADGDLARARVVREAIRELLYANNGHPGDGDPQPALGAAADAAALTIDFAAGGALPRAAGLDGVLGRVLVACFASMSDGTWARLKCCRNHACRWAFYDNSKNRSATWCSMQICGNRTKTRSYRHRTHGSPPVG
jgi:predicted RNA-binding Zn ribbon-like protein